MKNRFIPFISSLFLIASCSVISTSSSSDSKSSGSNSSYSSSDELSSSSESSPNIDSSSSSEEIIPEQPALPSSKEYFKLFNPDTEVSMELTLSDEVSNIISSKQGSSDYLKWKDFYFPGDFKITIDGEEYVFNEVGVKMKGNTSRHEFVNPYSDEITSLVNFKISFKATFDDENYLLEPSISHFYKEWSDNTERKARKDRNLFGLDKIDIKVAPRNDNNCLVSEIYAFETFRDNGIIAPRATLSSFKLQNVSSSMEGQMEIIECIDKTMMKRYFSKNDSKGDLYKCVYKQGKADFSRTNAVEKTLDSNGYNVGTRVSNGLIGVEDPYNLYVPSYQLKTNDDAGEDSDFSNMANFINAVWSTSYAGAPLSVLDNILDIDQFLKFSAVSYLLGGFDDQRYNYNNFYLYFVPSTGKVIYIPYDWDWCMGDYYSFNVSYLTPFDEYTISSNEPSAIYYSTFFKSNGSGHNISYDRRVMQNRYVNYINSAVNRGALSINKFTDLYEKYTGDRVSSEISRVSDYMNIKLSVYQDID